MGNKPSFPGVPRPTSDEDDFRRRQVLAAAAQATPQDPTAELLECHTARDEALADLDLRILDPDASPKSLAEQLVANLLEDLGPGRFDDVAVRLIPAFEAAMWAQVTINPP